MGKMNINLSMIIVLYLVNDFVKYRNIYVKFINEEIWYLYVYKFNKIEGKRVYNNF